MVGKGAKVASSLSKLAPKVMKWIWMYSAATNAPEMIASWEKMISSDGKMTSQDWENVMQSLNLVLGGAAAKGRNLKAKGVLDSNAKEINKAIKTVDNKVAVKLKDSAGNEKRVVFEGDDAKAIREADGNIDEIKKLTVDKFKDLEGYSVVESQNPFDGFSSPVKGWKVWSKENYQSPYRKKAKVDDVYT
jgi:putative sterol carrier protein